MMTLPDTERLRYNENTGYFSNPLRHPLIFLYVGMTANFLVIFMKGEGFAPNNEAEEKCPTNKACVPVVTFEEGHPWMS